MTILSTTQHLHSTYRLHWAPDINNYEMSIMAFHNKATMDDVRSQNPGRRRPTSMADGQNEA